MLAESVVFGAELPAQGRLFVAQDKRVNAQPDQTRIGQQANIAEKQRLTQDDADDADLHRVADMAVEARDDEMAGGQNRSRRAQSLQRKPREGFNQRD